MGSSSEDSAGIVEPLNFRVMSLMGPSGEDSAGIVEPSQPQSYEPDGLLQ